ncbi:MAG: dipeptide/oligopeptide/nickel ABC transporter ATP-binding protein [Chloroflexota bacterium]|nr:ABC transporter ATP-binding protein [Chloroflexota bacterium]NOG64041.1 ABC transporter ATP-binding protein [Chloroflexota bacterium]GIK65655.1 MAG: dipeptide/oligopeptide/nickel ABC transporter ATP-binding protein [Chloroflexota bacterium]
MNPENCLEIQDLEVHFHTLDGTVRGVDGVTLSIRNGETLGVVGESGCGKSVTAHSVMRLLPRRVAKISSGEVWFRRRDGQEVNMTTLDPNGSEIRSIRGNEIAMIFQEPMTSLSPMHTIGNQIMEAIMLHQKVGKREAEEKAIEMLQAVRIANPRQFVRSFPHQYSGGMRQRAMIAMALSCNPSLLIADEPTTALDVTIQAQILDLMRDLQNEFSSAIMMITHNLGVINEMADRIAVMYLGKVVEVAERTTLLKRPAHPYTVGLLQSVPAMGNQERTRLHPIPGMIPDPFNVPKGCAFFDRCPVKNKSSACQDPAGVPLVEVEPGHQVRCTLYS